MTFSGWCREVISLNHSWRFTPGYETAKRVYTEITLPHTWNHDALTGKADYYRGLGNYERELMVPESWKGKRLYLYFKGVNTVANVFVNGQHVAEHRGGYTAFAVDITSWVKYGEKNVIWVRVNNAFRDITSRHQPENVIAPNKNKKKYFICVYFNLNKSIKYTKIKKIP